MYVAEIKNLDSEAVFRVGINVDTLLDAYRATITEQAMREENIVQITQWQPADRETQELYQYEAALYPKNEIWVLEEKSSPRYPGIP